MTAKQKREYKGEMIILVNSPTFHNYLHLIEDQLELAETQLPFHINRLDVLPKLQDQLIKAQKHLNLALEALRRFEWESDQKLLKKDK
jgi:hypothetical protein